MPERFSLTARACRGILRRVGSRQIPPILRQAFEAVAARRMPLAAES
ncbi:MAG: hypothetical protein QM699_01570 [Amaricoccus sp.]